MTPEELAALFIEEISDGWGEAVEKKDIERLAQLIRERDADRGMNKHTPGPWIDSIHDEARNIRGPDGGIVAQMGHLAGRHGTMGRRDKDEVSANARLIAAAPDLLHALRQLLAAANPAIGTYSTNTEDQCALARAAIAKATGGDK